MGGSLLKIRAAVSAFWQDLRDEQALAAVNGPVPCQMTYKNAELAGKRRPGALPF